MHVLCIIICMCMSVGCILYVGQGKCWCCNSCISIPLSSQRNVTVTFFPAIEIALVGISDQAIGPWSDSWYVPSLRTFLLYKCFIYLKGRGPRPLFDLPQKKVRFSLGPPPRFAGISLRFAYILSRVFGGVFPAVCLDFHRDFQGVTPAIYGDFSPRFAGFCWINPRDSTE